MISAVGAIAQCEIARLFRRPFGWFVLALGEGLMALFFLLLTIRYLENQPDLRGVGVTAEIVMRYFSVANISVLLLTPILTMGSIAGDKRNGMLRFFYTTPLTTMAIVAGKYLGVLSLAFAYVVLVSLIPLTLLWGAPIDLGIYGANVLGLVLFTLLCNGLGLMASALTRAPVASALIALSLSLVLWLAEWAARLDPQASAAGGWSTLARLRGFSQGLVVTADIAYFCVAIIACISVTFVLVEADRKLA
jgi:ABC-2 type transport system permease protein